MGSFVPATENDRQEMFAAIGIESMEELFEHLPREARLKDGLDLPKGMSEMEVRQKMESIAAKNKVFSVIFRGAGAYRHYIPSIVKSVLSKETLYTAYTPYQAEISQGILQSIFEYQTMMCELTGMDTANASVYDGASAAAEAVAMCRDRKKNKALVSETIHPEVMETIKTYCYGNGMELILIPEKNGVTDLDSLQEQMDETTACIYIQHPNFYGQLEPASEIGEITKETKARFIVGVNPISLGILKTPREYGADIAVGEGQPLGLPLSFGGPYIGFMTCTTELTRKLPGRIVGETLDSNGKTGYVLTLQAREQHIRREKASSNICSNQALCALAVSVYLSAMGAEGLKQTAIQCMSKAHYMATQLEAIGYPLVQKGEYFHEFVTFSKKPPQQVMEALEEAGILGGYPLVGKQEGQILWCCTERNTKDEIDKVIRILKEV
ncbi:MAG: aminomethyl-transferring glycine dehydrogenase subunit GcvPA [Velocimicrobium sp.]